MFYSQPEMVGELVKVVKTGYAKHFNDGDNLKWSRVMGMILRDVTFANCSLTTLNAYSGKNITHTTNF